MTANRLKPYVPEKKKKPSHRERLKLSVQMKNTPMEAGAFAALSPLPMFWVSIFFSWIVGGIGFMLLGLNPVVKWFVFIPLVMFLFSPALGILGIIHSLIKIREKRAWLGLLLSMLCLVENALLFWGMFYLGKIA